MERKKSVGVVGCEGIELNGKVVVGWEGCRCGRPLEGEVRKGIDGVGAKVFRLLGSASVSPRRPAYWSSPLTRPQPNLLSSPATAQLSPFWTPLSSTQAPAADTITTLAAVDQTAQLLSGAAPRSIPSPETLRDQKL